ncbi:MAG: mandelate racemase/muconate lactonizing enzyme family protein [Clostridiales bacterium]|nr:mandelate racemase/muconate lactonizing enzyme family protein [Clostridiales bacterium]
MKITAVETYADVNQCMVRVRAGDAEGWGMTAPFSADITAQIVHRLAAPLVLGKDTADFREFADDIIRRQYKFLGSFVVRSAAGIDTALWDLAAKQENKTVADMVGKKRDEIPLYASSMRRNPQPLQGEADRLLGFCEKYGFQSVKLHPGIPVNRDVDFYPGCTEEFVTRARKTLPDGIKLIVDVNGNFSSGRAIEFAHFLKENGVSLFEEPCPYWELDEVKKVREACEKLGLPVAAGEQDYMDGSWDRMIGERIVDVAQPDLLYIGGFTRALRVAAACAKKGIPVTPHTSNRSPLYVLGLHFMSVVELPYSHLECGVEFHEWEEAAYLNAPPITGGKAVIPDGPGWGIKLNEDWLKKSVYQVSKL